MATLAEIKRRIRELTLDPAQGSAAELQRLRAEGFRLRRSRRRDDAASRSVAQRAAAEPSEGRDWRGLTEEDRRALETWPPELRAKVGEGAMSRVIVPGLRDDPGGYGARSDATRRSAWR